MNQSSPVSDKPPAKFLCGTGFVIWVAASIGAAAIFPYALAIAPGKLDAASELSGLTVAALVALSLAQSVIFLGVMTFTGLWAARKVGLGAPLLDAFLNRDPQPGGLLLLASLYGGISEEVQLRLFLFSFIALGISRLLRQVDAASKWQCSSILQRTSCCTSFCPCLCSCQ